MTLACIERQAVDEVLQNWHRFVPARHVESAVRVAGGLPTQGGGPSAGGAVPYVRVSQNAGA